MVELHERLQIWHLHGLDNSPQRFYSMSVHIELMRKEYYNSLETCQKGYLDITLWLNWFLFCLEGAIENADEAFSGVYQLADIS